MTKSQKKTEVSVAPEKPSDLESRLCEAGPYFERIEVRYTASNDDCYEWIFLDGRHKFPWEACNYLEIGPSFPRSIARVKASVIDKYEAYCKWLQNNQRDLSEYNRLKKKFG